MPSAIVSMTAKRGATGHAHLYHNPLGIILCIAASPSVPNIRRLKRVAGIYPQPVAVVEGLGCSEHRYRAC